jgi:hypothetical protein
MGSAGSIVSQEKNENYWHRNHLGDAVGGGPREDDGGGFT